MGQTRRRSDPAARRQAIVTATAELITEVGVDAVTHRMIAARADVPLGATTQYFDTLDDLRAAALAELAGEIEAKVGELKTILDAQGATPAVLTRLIVDGLSDAGAVHADRAVVTAAVHDPRVRELARLWSAALAEFLRPHYGEDRARAAAVFIDGLLWSALIEEAPPESAMVEIGLTGILVAPDAPPRDRLARSVRTAPAGRTSSATGASPATGTAAASRTAPAAPTSRTTPTARRSRE